jgi:uncharacterized protein YkwD
VAHGPDEGKEIMDNHSCINHPIHRRVVLRRMGGTALGAFALSAFRIPIGAATAFADPAFEQQWRAGEALIANFWGPLGNATSGLQEAYQGSSGGQRLVQYFDKGRMELTNGTVTNGLLAKQIIAGKVQIGDDIFEDRPASAIPIAGDADNPGPTYATLSGKAASLLAGAPARIGMPVTTTVAADGTIASDAARGGGPAAIGAYDDATGHNIAQAFAQYRDRAGMAAIGLAISEPFSATVRVAGVPKTVTIQAFERRVLTYTAENPEQFRVEMGNIGQHYLRWRYGDTLPPPAPPSAPSGQLDTEEAEFLSRIDAYRAQNNLPPLALSAALTRTAAWLSGDMATKGYFSHTDSLGRDLTERLRAFGVMGNTAWGENIAGGNASAAATFEQFRNSPEHNDNMLRREYKTIGIARAQGGPPYRWYWTTDFGTTGG